MASASSKRVLQLCVLLVAAAVSDGYLSQGFYDATCPQVASIVKQKVDKFVEAERGIAAALQRLHFHDCFVRGCDGSVLVDSTEGNVAEKDALLNKGSLRGFEQIDEIKEELEQACPGVVSCADILALAARDATAKVGGVKWPVYLGRIDGGVSIGEETNGSLPERTMDFSQLVSNFAKVGLSAKDMVILSGGHSIGRLHCGAFRERLYDFEGQGITDPSMDADFAEFAKSQCPSTTPLAFFPTDSTNGNFDSTYYQDLLTNKGRLESDVAIVSDPIGLQYAQMAVENPEAFLYEFGEAMIKMGDIQTVDPYGWRRHCAIIEPRNY